jgi:carbonic anhydrase/acetyltransferase-like protein (isoleucine patch superfamily)
MRLIEHHGVHPEVPPSAFVAEGACLIGEVTLGRDSSVWFNAVLRGDINAIRIGDRSNVQDGVIIHVTHRDSVMVGKEVTIGHQAVIHGCELCDGSLIGMGAVVLDGARVGPQALVAAGSVVLEKSTIPEGMLAAGVPARIIRPLTGQERTSLLGSAQHYVEYARSYQRQSTPGDPSCA